MLLIAVFMSLVLYFESEYKRIISEPDFTVIDFVAFLTTINEEFTAPHDTSNYSNEIKLGNKGVIIKKYVDKGKETDQVNLIIYNKDCLIDTIHAHFSIFTHVDSLSNIGSYVYYYTNDHNYIAYKNNFKLIKQNVTLVPYGAIKVSRTKIQNN